MLKLLGQPVAEKLRLLTAERVASFKKLAGRSPKLSVVLVGEDPASVIYTRKKGEAALAIGMEHETLRLPPTASVDEVRAAVVALNNDSKVDGILIQRPLPRGFKEEEVLYWVDPEKDVDAFHPTNAGRLWLGLPTFKPCTPAGVMAILDHYGINPSGKIACIVGRSSIVGKPMGALLMQRDATVLQCHSKTPDLASISRTADIVVAAIGKPGFIGKNHIKAGAVVVDVGINRNAAGKIVGDVNYDEVSQVASAITPVPGGVGPMTIAILLENTVSAAEAREKKRQPC